MPLGMISWEGHDPRVSFALLTAGDCQSTSLHDPQPDGHYDIQSSHGLPPHFDSTASDTVPVPALFSVLEGHVHAWPSLHILTCGRLKPVQLANQSLEP